MGEVRRGEDGSANARKKIKISIYYLAAYLLILCGYYFFVVPTYGYEGWKWLPEKSKIAEGAFVAVFLPLILPIQFKRPSDILLHLQMLFPILPMLVLYGAVGYSRQFLLATIAALLLLVLIVNKARFEVGRTDLDTHGRFLASSSHAFKHGYLERPIVDEWLHILGQVIEHQWPQIKLKVHQFGMKVSHDVDSSSRYGFCSIQGLFRVMGGDILKRKDFKSAFLAPWIRLNSRTRLHASDPYNTFDWIMDVSEQHGLTSAFYFICGRTSTSKDADYEPEHPVIRRLMRRIHVRGHEVGLHPSYNTYQDPQAILAEAKRLKRICHQEGIIQSEWGGRMHYLRWEHPTTLRAWQMAGMTYDSTLSYADHTGFRCGTCFEYPAFDPVKNEMLSLRIRPLIVMERSVIAEGYMGLGYSEEAMELILSYKRICKQLGGCFSLLWHNSHFATTKDKGFYQGLM